MPPGWMIDVGLHAGNFFETRRDSEKRKTYRLKSREQYSEEHNTREQPSKEYFTGKLLPEIIHYYNRASTVHINTDTTSKGIPSLIRQSFDCRFWSTAIFH